MAYSAENIFITYVDAEHDLLKIWGQQDRTCAMYIEKQLFQLTPEFNRSTGPDPSLLCKGMPCFAKYADDNYYRARIMSSVQCNFVEVFFVDYGNRDRIDLSNIRILDGQVGSVLSKIVAQADEFYLAGVVALPGGWTAHTLDDIRRDLCYEEFQYKTVQQLNREKLIQICFRNNDYKNVLFGKKIAREISLEYQQRYIMNLRAQNYSFKPNNADEFLNLNLFMSDQAQKNINHNFDQNNRNNRQVSEISQPITSRLQFVQHDVLCTNSPASQVQKNLQCVSPPLSNSRQIYEQSVLSAFNSNQASALPTQHVNVRTVQENPALPPVNNYVIEVLADQVKQHLLKDSQTVVPDSPPSCYITQTLQIGTTYSVYVTHVDDGPWSFSVQLVSNENELNQLIFNLNQLNLIPVKLPLVLGYPCIAKSQEFDSLFRGVVVNISRDAVKVFYVDFGNAEDLPLSAIYELPSNFFEVKVLSQKFSLSGLHKIKYMEDIKKAFVEIVDNELLVLQVTNLEGENLPTCDLYLKGQNIKRFLNDTIINNGWDGELLPKKGDITNVMVTWVESPQKFFIQLKNNENDLELLKTELKDWGNKGLMFRSEELEVNLPCCCCFSGDNEWYRAIITSVDSQNSVTVFYVDFGNLETVNSNMIRKIGTAGLHTILPTQAIQCCLHGYENGTSDESTTNFLKDLILDKELNMKVMQTTKNRIIVKLFKNDSDISLALLQRLKSPQARFLGQQEKLMKAGEENIQRLLVVNKEMKTKFNGNYNTNNYENARVRDFSRNSEKKEINSWRDGRSNITPSLYDSRNNMDVDIKRDFKNEKQGRYGFTMKKTDTFNFEKNSEKPWRKTSENENKKIASSRANVCEKNNINYESDWSYESNTRSNSYHERNLKKESEDSKFKSTAVNHPIKPENIVCSRTKLEPINIQLGSTEEVILTHFLNPNEIYIQLLSKQAEFRQMMEDIQVYYRNKVPVDNMYKFQEEDLVIVKFKQDEVLYRGKILKIAPLTVHYLDYGNEEITEKERLWLMDDKYSELEAQCIKCSLVNLKPKGSNSWSFSSNEVNKIFDHDKYLCTFLDGKEKEFEVSLKIFENGEDVRDKLISLGFAISDDSIDENPIDLTLMCGEAFSIFISDIVNISEFYIQINRNILQAIEKDIERYVMSEECASFSEKFSLDKGMLCLARDDKDRWLRAKSIYQTENSVLVQFIDYGNKLEVTYDKIKFIPDYLKKIQSQAFESCLFSLSSESDVEVNKKFKNCMHSSFTAFVHKADESRLYLTLYDFKGAKIEFLADFNEAPSQIFPITSAPFIKQGIPVTLSYIDSPKEIFIHLMNDTSSLEDFNSKMNYFYNGNTYDFDMDQTDDINEVCVAKSITDNFWYRAKLLNMIDDKATVLYIDYGNIEEVPKKNIKELNCSFYYQYAFAKKVTLNLKYTEEEAESISQQISDLILNNECLGYFVKRGDITYAELFVDGVRISDVLKSENREKLYDDLFENILPVNSEIKISSECNSVTAMTEEAVPEETIEKKEVLEEAIEEKEVLKEGIEKKEVPEKVFISHVSSPNEFWILDENRSDEIDVFQNNLQNICSNSKNKYIIAIGDVIGGLYTDGLWYRVKVKDMKINVLMVQLIDFGNSFEINLNSSHVKELPEDVLKVPEFVNSCSLTGNWKKDASSRFESIVAEYQDPFTLVEVESTQPKIVDLIANGISITKRLIEEGLFDGPEPKLYSEDNFVYIVHINSPNDFYIQRECDETILNEIANKLTKAETFEDVRNPKENKIYCLKFCEDNLWYRVKVLKRNGNDVQIHFIDYGNCDTAHYKELKLLPATLEDIPQLSFNCCLTYGSSHDTWSEEACQKFMEYLNDTRLKMEVVLQGVQKSVVKLFDEIGENLTEKLAPLCEKDERIEVYVTHVNSPSDFYIMEANNEYFNYISQKLREADTFEELNNIREGIYCASKSDTGIWHRAKILRSSSNHYETLFIDIGNVCSKSSSLKKLPPEIESIEPLAKNCSLNFSVKNIPESIKEEFRNLTKDGDTLFRALIIKQGNRDVISLMLDGKKLEEVLLYTISENSEIYNICLESENQNFENVSNDKESTSIKAINDISTIGNYEEPNIEDDIWARNPFGNETDEEKRYKFSMIIGDNVEGFRSDDEKGILDNSLINSNMVNIPDNDLLEDCAGNTTDFNSEICFHSEPTLNSVRISSVDAKEGLCIETSVKEKFNAKNSGSVEKQGYRQTEVNVTNETSDNVELDDDDGNKISNEIDDYLGKDDASVEMYKNEESELACGIQVQTKLNNESLHWKDKEDRIISYCACGAELLPETKDKEKIIFIKLSHSERIVPGSITRGISTEEVSNEFYSFYKTSYSNVKTISSSSPNLSIPESESENYFDGFVPKCICYLKKLKAQKNKKNF